MVRAASTPAKPGDPGRGIVGELTVLGLALTGLAVAFVLILSMYGSPPALTRGDDVEVPPIVAIAPVKPIDVISPVVVPPPPPTPAREESPTSVAESDDPTPVALATLESEAVKDAQATDEAERRASVLRAARKAAEDSATRRLRAETVLKSRAQALEKRAEAQESLVEATALEIDILAQRTEAKKRDLAKAEERAKSGYAIQPYKGPNGTWRCPVVIDCGNGQVALAPSGPSFTLLDLEGVGIGFRAFLVAVNRAAAAASRFESPDGADVIPYVLFVVRPDGIRPYYSARQTLERLGVPYGYELVSQDAVLDYPDLGDPSEWPEAGPLGGHGELAKMERAPARANRNGSGSGGGLAAGGDNPRSTASTEPADRVLDGVDRRGLGFGEERGGLGLGGERNGSGFGDVRGGPGVGGNESSGQRRPSGLATRSGDGSGTYRGAGTGGAQRPNSSPVVPAMPKPGYVPRGRDLDRLSRAGPWGQTHEPDFQGLDQAVNDAGSALSRLGGDRDPRLEGNDDGNSSGRPGDLVAEGREGIGFGKTPNTRPTMAPTGPFSGGSDAMTGAPGPLPREVRGDTARDGTGSGRSGTAGRPGTGGQSGSSSLAGTPGAVGSPGASGGTPGQSGGMPGLPGLPGGGTPQPSRSPVVEGPPVRDLELVVVCSPSGVILHPGAYRVTTAILKEKPERLASDLRKIHQAQQVLEPKVILNPKLRFLVQPGGAATYELARGQTLLQGIDWPMRIQVGGTDPLRLTRGVPQQEVE